MLPDLEDYEVEDVQFCESQAELIDAIALQKSFHSPGKHRYVIARLVPNDQLSKAGYKPSQLRADNGRWVKGWRNSGGIGKSETCGRIASESHQSGRAVRSWTRRLWKRRSGISGSQCLTKKRRLARRLPIVASGRSGARLRRIFARWTSRLGKRLLRLRRNRQSWPDEPSLYFNVEKATLVVDPDILTHEKSFEPESMANATVLMGLAAVGKAWQA